MTRPRSDAPPGYRFVAALVRWCYRLARWRIDTQGFEHVPLTVVPMLGETGRWVRFLAPRELWQSRLLGWVPRLARCVPVDRGSATGRVDAFRDALTALRAGDLVMVAPEGTISESLEPLHVGPDDDPLEATARLQQRVEALLAEAWQAYPDGAPAGAWWVPASLGGGAPTRTA